jgi:UDP-glucose 4-epimerase
LQEVIGEGEIVYKESRHEVNFSNPAYQKSIDILEFKHKTDLKDGLTNMWNWAKEQPKRERFIWPSYELDKGIYEYWETKSKL